MVITDVPFGRPNLIQDRYVNLLRPGMQLDEPPSEDEDEEAAQKTQEYAAFLKKLKDSKKKENQERPYSDGPSWLRDKERMCGAEGFVDSARQQHSYRVRNSNKTKSKDTSASADQSRTFTVVDLAAIKQRDQKEHDKRLKVIEDHMWQHKQDQRELKRVEGDIIKNQREVRKELRDYENAITRKRLAEEKKLNQGLERFTNLQQKHVHEKETLVNKRKDQNISIDQNYKDGDRKVQLTTNDLARQYRTKVSELELRRIELNRLSEEFESKMRRKEDEQYMLKQELAELAISLNMEAQKGRVQRTHHREDLSKETKGRIESDLTTQQDLDTKVAKSDGVTKAAINEKRKLSANLAVTRAHLSLKAREESRAKYDTEQRLKNNQAEQRALNEAALQQDLDLKQKKIEQKITEVNSRKHVQLMTSQVVKKDHAVKHETFYTHKFAKRFSDQNRREHEDHLKHFQKVVQMGEEQEYNLYNKVKNAEYARQKREQSVRKVQTKLLERRRDNAVKLKHEMLEMTKEERDIEYQLERQRAELAKVHASREECYEKLQKHRATLRTDRHYVNEHQREHERLIKIGQRTEAMAASVEDVM